MRKLFFLNLLFLLAACQTEVQQAETTIPNIIFETDMGNDIDDALALALLYSYRDEGKINLLATCSNKESRYSTEYIHLLNYWYGYPDIPIGKVINGIDCESDLKDYAEAVCIMKNSKGEEFFPHPGFDFSQLPEAVSLYRKILSVQPDSSVTIISVGFSTNIVRLLDSTSDEYSALSGKELIARKVRLLSVMAGSFGDGSIAEYNIVKDIPSARKLADEWPTTIVYTPFEAGNLVLYPVEVIEQNFECTPSHPVVEGYKNFLQMPYDRPTWDLIAALYAVEPSDCYFTQSAWGKVSVNEEGYTSFMPTESGKHAYLTMSSVQADSTRQYFIERTTRPRKFR